MDSVVRLFNIRAGVVVVVALSDCPERSRCILLVVPTVRGAELEIIIPAFDQVVDGGDRLLVNAVNRRHVVRLRVLVTAVLNNFFYGVNLAVVAVFGACKACKACNKRSMLIQQPINQNDGVGLQL